MVFREEWAGADKKSLIKSFLEEQGLRYEDDTDASLLVYQEGKIVGTASCRGKIIKGVAVKENLRGSGLGRQMVNRIIEYQRSQNIFHSIIYTTPEASASFMEMGFREVCRAEPWVVMLEQGFKSFDSFIKEVKETIKEVEPLKETMTAVITYTAVEPNIIPKLLDSIRDTPLLWFLAGKAASKMKPQNAEDQSGDWCYPRVIWIEGKDYVVSLEDMPGYFLGNHAHHFTAWATLESHMFVKISRHVGIKTRLLWPETPEYNQIARPVLEKAGLETQEVSLIP